MERCRPNGHDWDLMEAVPSPRRMIPVLVALAVVCVLPLLLGEPGPTPSPAARALTAGASFVLAGVTIAAAGGTRDWPGQRSLGAALIVVGASPAVFGLIGVATDRAFEPHPIDVVLLV